MKTLLFSIWLGLPAMVPAQDISREEKILSALLDTIGELHYQRKPNPDSVQAINEHFREKLIHMLENNPETFDYVFPLLREKMLIITSPDSMLKAYTWRAANPGLLKDWQTIYQYRNSDSLFVFSLQELDERSIACREIFTVSYERETVYLISIFAEYNSAEHLSGIQIISWEHSHIKKRNWFSVKPSYTALYFIDSSLYQIVYNPVTFAEPDDMVVKYTKATEKAPAVLWLPVINGDICNYYPFKIRDSKTPAVHLDGGIIGCPPIKIKVKRKPKKKLRNITFN